MMSLSHSRSFLFAIATALAVLIGAAAAQQTPPATTVKEETVVETFARPGQDVIELANILDSAFGKSGLLVSAEPGSSRLTVQGPKSTIESVRKLLGDAGQAVPPPVMPAAPAPMGPSVMYPVAVPRHGVFDAPPAMDEETRRLIPQYASLESEVQKILREKPAEAAEADSAARKRLRELLSQQFDLRLQVQVSEIKRLQERLEKVKSLADRRKEAKEEIVDRRMGELLNEDEALRWEPLAAGAARPSQPAPATVFRRVDDSIPVSPIYSAPLERTVQAAPADVVEGRLTSPYFAAGASDESQVFAVLRRLSEAQGAVAQAQEIVAHLGPLVADGRKPTSDLAVEHARLEGAKRQLELAMREREALRSLLALSVRDAQLTLEERKAAYERIKSLSEKGMVQKSELERAQAALQRADLQVERLETLRSHLNQEGAGSTEAPAERNPAPNRSR